MLRPRPVAVLLSTAAALAGAPAALAAAPVVELKVSSHTTYAGAILTVSVRSSAAGYATLSQLRPSPDAQRCAVEYPLSELAEGAYGTPGAWQTFKIAGSSLRFVGGNPFANPRGSSCYDPFTQFKYLVAGLSTPAHEFGSATTGLYRAF